MVSTRHFWPFGRPLSQRAFPPAVVEEGIELGALESDQFLQAFRFSEARLLAFTGENVGIPVGLPGHERGVLAGGTVERIEEDFDHKVRSDAESET